MQSTSTLRSRLLRVLVVLAAATSVAPRHVNAQAPERPRNLKVP
jgi:hypothetical protein